MAGIEKYLSEKTIEYIRQAIADAGDNEVFFVGYTEEDLIVHDIQVVARGNENTVPAVLSVARDADVVIHNHPSGFLKPSGADLSIASHLDDFSVAFYIVNNKVNNIYVVVEPFTKKDIYYLDPPEIQGLLQPGAAISKTLSGFESRPQQHDMIDVVSAAFNQKKIAMIEAGTGTGKTMAYLLPAIYWAVKNKARVVISTNTINLQEQLVKKDIPLLQQALDLEFEAILVKGRSNYVCLRKVDDVASDFAALADEDELEEMNTLIGWARQSKDGSKADLSYIPKSTTWEKIAAESDTCTRSRCKHFRTCFVNKARRNAARAQILIVNHHLLFADLAIRKQTGSFEDAAILPPYQCIIFDEAHHLENVATNYFGSRITRAGISRILGRLHRQRKAVAKGHLHTIRHKLLKGNEKLLPEQVQKIVTTINTTLLDQVDTLAASTDEIMDYLYEVLSKLGTESEEREVKIRLLPTVVQKVFFDTPLGDYFKEYILNIKDLSLNLGVLVNLVRKAVVSEKEEWDNIIIELEANAERLAAAGDILKDVIFRQDDENIRWIEARPGYRSRNLLHFQISPLQVKDMMKQAVFDSFDTVILTSATLTTDKSFKFLSERLGIAEMPPNKVLEMLLPAPFDYEKQVIMAVPTDMPDPRNSNFATELAAAILQSVKISNGRAFILFTSYGLLQIIYRQLEAPLQSLGIRALKQGGVNRHELLKEFKTDKTSVLFGTDSFWEGVDVEGDALESVIITKLPFRVPSEPVIEARYEAIELKGGNPFMEYAVPMAVLQFKQGFGRLIRRKTDRGCVIIFDNRVVTKSYGKRFLSSLPKCHNVIAKKEDIYIELEKFFSRQS